MLRDLEKQSWRDYSRTCVFAVCHAPRAWLTRRSQRLGRYVDLLLAVSAFVILFSLYVFVAYWPKAVAVIDVVFVLAHVANKTRS